MTAYLHIISTANALIAFTALYLIFIRPAYANDREAHLKLLVAPHLFRYLGLIALYPALFPVRGLGFSEDYLAQIAWGDFAAGALALVALVALHDRSALANPLVWIFHIIGLADFANAGLSMVAKLSADPSAVGPLGWVLLTFYLPMLMVSHIAIFSVLLSQTRSAERRAGLAPAG